MSANPEVQSIVGVISAPEELAPEPVGYLSYEGKPRAARPAWFVPASAAAAAVLVVGGLGFTLYTTTQQRDVARHQLETAQAALGSTRDRLSSAQADAAARQAVAAYVAVYVSDSAKVQTDYFDIVNCANFSECRTAAQQMLTDMQQFQADRAALTVPSALISSDNSLGDALSAAIAGDQEFITGIDNSDDAKAKEGGSKVDAAMLNVSKAEAALGAQLR